jgi:hypothetical protein
LFHFVLLSKCSLVICLMMSFYQTHQNKSIVNLSKTNKAATFLTMNSSPYAEFGFMGSTTFRQVSPVRMFDADAAKMVVRSRLAQFDVLQGCYLPPTIQPHMTDIQVKSNRVTLQTTFTRISRRKFLA